MVWTIRFLRLMQLLTHAAAFVVPRLRRAILFVLWFGLTAIAIFWRAVPSAVRDMADRWHDLAVAAGFPTEYDNTLHTLLSAAAILIIAADWILLSYLTITLLRLIF